MNQLARNLARNFRNTIQGKKVVIIGKASELLNNNYAALVDECDVVIRVNVFVDNGRADLHPDVAKHTTPRTDIVYHNSCVVGEVLENVKIRDNVGMGSVLARSYAASGVKFVVRIDDSGHDSIYDQFSETVPTFRSPNVVRRNVFRAFDEDVRGLTSGTKAVVDLLSYEPAELHIIGMDAMISAYVPGPPEFEDHNKKHERACTENPTECRKGAHKPFDDLKMLLKAYERRPDIVRPSQHLVDVWEKYGLKRSPKKLAGKVALIGKAPTLERVCVVGNGPSTLKKSLGKTIDACDVVIRLNDFETAAYAEQIGTKTDLWFCGMGVQQKPRHKSPTQKVVVWSHVKETPLKTLVKKKIDDVRDLQVVAIRSNEIEVLNFDNLGKGTVVTTLAPYSASSLANEFNLKTFPTTGFAAVVYAIRTFGSETPILITGFDAKINNRKNMNHYSAMVTKNFVAHDFEGEHRAFKQFESAGQIKIV
jgi:hypothetical protein